MQAFKVAVLLGDPRLPYAYAMGGVFGDEELLAVEHLREALSRLPGYRFSFHDDHSRWIDDLRADPPDLALNLCDTGFRNDWELERDVPALMEILGIPYTGADPMSISLTTDKALVRALAVGQGIPVPNETYVDLAATPLTLPTIYPCLIKPNSSGGSFGITQDCVVRDAAEAEAYLRWLAEQPGVVDALIQDFLTGPEYTLGLVGNIASGLTVLPPLEIDYSALDPDLPPILTHGSKADPDSPYWDKLGFRRAEIDEVTRSQLVEHAVRLFRRLGLRDYARIDFRAGEDGQPRLLDVNTNPTWYWDGKLALMAEWAGHSYHELLCLILEAAISRQGLGGPG
ncbi:D-alanine--D-alanine ligase [Pistricoccus aurantiacus]|uniref:D-alanine--D-alanine ligase n=1 Tax=Pistricoccus aurantiacus TaxID=1883414 RepID=A0A5B8SUE7_9GAMM|nr:D-alanine--D-alanine ligase [Pistricoccus aurantiacus]QEA39647.1 D-alanine--D-alanine ligase [Pistricoccus aurantiacus]